MDSTAAKASLRSFFDELAPSREAYVKRHPAYYDDLHRFLTYAIRADATVLEIGCGAGSVLARLPNAQKTGIDFSPALIERAKSADPTSTYLVDDIENLQHKRTYDFVLLLDTVNSLYDVQESFRQIASKLCDDRTRLIVTFHNFLWKPLLTLGAKLKWKTPMPPQNWLSPGDVDTLLELAGFEVLYEGERFLWPWNTPLIGPLINRFLVKLPVFRWFSLTHYMVARKTPEGRREYSVSVVIPARNEAGNIQRAVDSMPTFGKGVEVVFIENNSTDDTWAVMESVKQRYTGPHRLVMERFPARNKAEAVWHGFRVASGELLMILDADLTVDPSDLPKFYEPIATGHGEFVNGSRLVYPMEERAMRLLNIIGNKVFSLLFTWLLGQRIKDTLCGTKVLLKSTYEHIRANRGYFGNFDSFGDYDLLFGAAKQQLKIVEVPIRYRDRTYGETKMQRWRYFSRIVSMCAYAAMKIKFL